MFMLCICFFSELVKVVHKFTNGENSMENDKNLVILIRGFAMFVKEGKYGARVCECFIKCIGRCAVVCIILFILYTIL